MARTARLDLDVLFEVQMRFAHGDSDLRVTAGIYKTQICNFYERGHCKKGDRCNHAHGDADLRPMMSPQKTPVKEKGPVVEGWRHIGAVCLLSDLFLA